MELLWDHNELVVDKNITLEKESIILKKLKESK